MRIEEMSSPRSTVVASRELPKLSNYDSPLRSATTLKHRDWLSSTSVGTAFRMNKRRRIATASVLLPWVSLLAASSISATMSGRSIVTTLAVAHLYHYVCTHIVIPAASD
jgi:hypothetical protein